MVDVSHILGCLLGTAVGDAAGLRREGLSRRRAFKLYGGAVSPDLIAGYGLCSDDTEHTLMVARALAVSKGDPKQFEKLLASQLKRWLLTVPAGIGLATLKSCLKLLVGFPPARSGIFSAGNGPAMRSALLGVISNSDDQCRELVRRSTRITHTDPKAEEGALLVARAAGLAAGGSELTPLQFLQQACDWIQGQDLKERISAACHSLEVRTSPDEFAESQGCSKGVSGYTNQTVPAALYCWAYTPDDYRAAVTNAVLLGGDTDSVAAITGAVMGANLGEQCVPDDWLAQLVEWPRTISWMRRMADVLSEHLQGDGVEKIPSMRWLATLPRNALFASIVLMLGFRRLLPPC